MLSGLAGISVAAIIGDTTSMLATPIALGLCSFTIVVFGFGHKTIDGK